MTTSAGLRERKKQATRKALREAALRLAMERGPDNVRVEDIAEAAGVSPRTYNNYFSSREQAIVAAITAEREARIAAAVADQPANVRLADAVTEAIVNQYTDPGSNHPGNHHPDRHQPDSHHPDSHDPGSHDPGSHHPGRHDPDSHDPGPLLLITTRPALREAFLDTAAEIEHPLAEVITERLGKHRHTTAQVLAASVAAAVRIALRQWIQPAANGLVIPTGSLPDLLRTALAPLAPALDAAEDQR